jgi:hypothetical protein
MRYEPGVPAVKFDCWFKLTLLLVVRLDGLSAIKATLLPLTDGWVFMVGLFANVTFPVTHTGAVMVTMGLFFISKLQVIFVGPRVVSVLMV